MCDHCGDLNRTVLMLGFLVMYAEQPDHDEQFADVVGGALAMSLPLDDAASTYGLPPEPGSER
ncbi:hypothetical protein H9Y04_30380 [Streptomyces sp. TRM66268-LWL]|uniref:Uncharacterized protein n=1 Tax=Streptomyces polyasparticus TaxID=2767826 RepID=A0ABR7SMY9_9ACTN|nr:hypothetical protein [Streptomyces polyasparticus]MBC9716850.1 hypothetical protein [Streptomyces polyasparticus]